MRRLYISDIHMGAAEAVAPSTGKPYGWLSEAEAATLGAFLRSPQAAACDEVFIVGDFVDLWICPIDVCPPRPRDVFAAPQNQPIVDALDALRGAGKVIRFLPGNHDMDVVAADVAPLGIEFHTAPFVDGLVSVSHGHERCLFNGSDPAGRPRPFGYYISRFVATATHRDAGGAGFDLWLALKNPDEVLALATGGTSLGEAVFDVVVAAAGLRLDERVLEADGSSVAVGDVRAMYADLFDEWNRAGRNAAVEAVACEWDPWYGLPFAVDTLAIAGHSHLRTFSFVPDARRLYMNLGTWTRGTPCFAVTWTDPRHTWGALYKWRGTHAQFINKAGLAR
ncbi:MAG: hypothetical protein R3B06_30935 [Kofleriaceae bacterium]